MDTSQQKIARYEALILDFLSEHQGGESVGEAYRRMVVADRENHHY